MTRRYQFLLPSRRAFRIVITMAFALLTVCLCGLWARSYWKFDALLRDFPSSHLQIQSNGGQVRLLWTRPRVQPRAYHSEWHHVVGAPRPREAGATLYWTRHPQVWNVEMPYWLLVAVAILPGVWCWFPAKFTVRGLLVVTALAAVLAAAVASAVRG